MTSETACSFILFTIDNWKNIGYTERVQILDKGAIHRMTISERIKSLDIPTLFMWFIIYSYIGWVYETIYCSVDLGRFVERGFLYGPVCPIYGTCITFMILLFSDRCKSRISLFLSCAALASVLEYVVSFMMEHVFGKRWWNYSNRLFNINGRICLGAAVVFGVSGLLIVRYLHPNLVRYINENFNMETQRKILKFILAIFLFDLFASIQMNL
jgi:uncharacterized membrane protein